MSNARTDCWSGWDCAGCGLPIPASQSTKPCSNCGAVEAVPDCEDY